MEQHVLSQAASQAAHPATPTLERRWYVVDASVGEPVGPVSVDQIARGIIHGSVPRDAYVACEGDPVWQEILDVPEVVAALKSL
jgi:hypothetical protein